MKMELISIASSVLLFSSATLLGETQYTMAKQPERRPLPKEERRLEEVYALTREYNHRKDIWPIPKERNYGGPDNSKLSNYDSHLTMDMRDRLSFIEVPRHKGASQKDYKRKLPKSEF